jgi:hypothetical protein
MFKAPNILLSSLLLLNSKSIAKDISTSLDGQIQKKHQNTFKKIYLL